MHCAIVAVLGASLCPFLFLSRPLPLPPVWKVALLVDTGWECLVFLTPNKTSTNPNNSLQTYCLNCWLRFTSLPSVSDKITMAVVLLLGLHFTWTQALFMISLESERALPQVPVQRQGWKDSRLTRRYSIMLLLCGQMQLEHEQQEVLGSCASFRSWHQCACGFSEAEGGTNNHLENEDLEIAGLGLEVRS